MTENPSVVQTLQHAAEGLWLMSETDEPFIPFFWPSARNEELNTEALQRLTEAPEGASIEAVDLDYFFRNMAEVEEWHDVIQAAQVEEFKQLVRTIKATLRNAQVFRVGDLRIDIYIVGQIEGGYAGLQTAAVET